MKNILMVIILTVNLSQNWFCIRNLNVQLYLYMMLHPKFTSEEHWLENKFIKVESTLTSAKKLLRTKAVNNNTLRKLFTFV